MSDTQNQHIVNAYSTSRIVWNCANNQSLSICPHTIIYAEHQKIQPKFFYNWLKKLSRIQGSNAINFSNLVSADIPRERGRKGERPSRRAEVTTTQTITGVTASISTLHQETQVNQQTGNSSNPRTPATTRSATKAGVIGQSANTFVMSIVRDAGLSTTTRTMATATSSRPAPSGGRRTLACTIQVHSS